MSFLSLSTLIFFLADKYGGTFCLSLLFWFCSCLKVMGGVLRWWVGGVVAHEILVSAQGPLVLVLRLRVRGQA